MTPFVTESFVRLKRSTKAMIENGLGAAHRPSIPFGIGCDGSALYSAGV